MQEDDIQEYQTREIQTKRTSGFEPEILHPVDIWPSLR